MKLSEAIYRTNLVEGVEAIKGEPKFIEALELLIAAGERLQHDRQWGAAVSRTLLPGETRE